MVKTVSGATDASAEFNEFETGNNHQLQQKVVIQPLLVLQIVDMTRLDASLVYNPNRNIVEDRRYIDDYSIKQISMVLTRTKLIITLLEYIINADALIFNFYYPRFSYACWVGIQLFIYFFDSRYLLSYLVLLLIWLVAVYSETWEKHISPVVTEMFFT